MERLRKPAGTVGRVVGEFWHRAYESNVTGAAGMLAYALLLSIFPFLLLVGFVAGEILKTPAVFSAAEADVLRLFPGTESETIRGVLDSLRTRSTTIGVLALVGGLYTSMSYWGAMDTAFCRIYPYACRSWLVQKRFSLEMLAVTFLFILTNLGLPFVESAIALGASNLPFGLDEIAGSRRMITMAIGGLLLFTVLCIMYRTVPNGKVPWRSIWPGAFLSTLVLGALNLAFPFYLNNVSTTSSVGGTMGFVVIVLVWFYVASLIVLGGAIANAIRLPASHASE